MSSQDFDLMIEESQSRPLKERLRPYTSAWPVFLIAVILCMSGGFLFVRNTVPKYLASTSFLVKQSEGDNAPNDLIARSLSGKPNVNLSNDMMLVSSKKLMERTVARYEFNITYRLKGRLYSADVYQEAPFSLAARQVTDSSRSYTFQITRLEPRGGTFSYGPEDNGDTHQFVWGQPFNIGGQVFVLTAKNKVEAADVAYTVEWAPVAVAAANLLSNLTVQVFDPETNAINLSIKTENRKKGMDLLDALVVEFNRMDIEDRTKLSESTVAFIDDRLLNISKELKGVEGSLEMYQGSKQIVDIKSQSTQSLANSDETAKTIKQIAIKQGIASMIGSYFANPVGGGKLVPSSMGLEDPTLTALISQYNEVQLRREKEAPLVAPNSTVMQDLNAQLASLRGSILESLTNLNKNLRMQQAGLQQQKSSYQNFLSAIPHNERVLQEIRRKQSITEGLYLYLLQKREEAAISSTSSSVPHYKQVDAAEGWGPVEPNKRNILLASAMMGLLLAFGLVYLRHAINDKIANRSELLRHTQLPIIAEITHVPKTLHHNLMVQERSLYSEELRTLRTNLSFLLKDKPQKTILVTSSQSGEGKSVTSLNLAAVYAITGKKVALLEFDIRRPGLHEELKLDNEVGLTTFLCGEADNLGEILQLMPSLPALHVYTSGPVVINPADLLSSERMQLLFAQLKAAYEYIIIDTPPAGLVSDPCLIGLYTDLVLYLVRSNKTTREQLRQLEERVQHKTLANVKVILNDIRQKGKEKSYQGYYFRRTEKGECALMTPHNIRRLGYK